MSHRTSFPCRVSSLSFFLCISGTLILLAACTRVPREGYPITPVPFAAVEVHDDFWSPRLETNAAVTLDHVLDQCEETGRLANFDAAAAMIRAGRTTAAGPAATDAAAIPGTVTVGHQGYFFNDSDVYKIIEGAANSLRLYPDPGLQARVQEIVNRIATAQEPDGYLYTARTAMTPNHLPPGGVERWSDVQWGHELYCAGHLYEGAVAWHEATGDRTLLEVAVRNADLIDAVFGPDGRRYPPGHEQIEMGLVRLWRATGTERYRDLAAFFIAARGDSTGHPLYGEYAQDHRPVSEQTGAVGHAVRAAYLYSGLADVAVVTGRADYLQALDRIWTDAVSTKLYVTGGIGATGGNEGFSHPYVLPNESAYCETCASIANAMWNHRLFLLKGEARYLDVLERTVYNAFLSGISLTGDRFFYPNRLASAEGAERSAWFNCACCPSNVVRFLPALPGYVYAHAGDKLYVNLFVASTATVPLAGGPVGITQQSRYPWNGVITVRPVPAEAGQRFTLNLRCPGWAQNEAVPSDLYRFTDIFEVELALFVNGERQPLRLRRGFIRIQRAWHEGDEVKLLLPMPIRRITAHQAVEADRGRVALQQGPIVYCLEAVDTDNITVGDFVLPPEAGLRSEFVVDLLGGAQVIHGRGLSTRRGIDGTTIEERPVAFTAIPYHLWAHRSRLPMQVWLAASPGAAEPLSATADSTTGNHH